MNTYLNFQSADLFEGDVINIAKLDSVFGCIIACHQLKSCCVGTSYDPLSIECQMLVKETYVPTTRFVPGTVW